MKRLLAIALISVSAGAFAADKPASKPAQKTEPTTKAPEQKAPATEEQKTTEEKKTPEQEAKEKKVETKAKNSDKKIGM